MVLVPSAAQPAVASAGLPSGNTDPPHYRDTLRHPQIPPRYPMRRTRALVFDFNLRRGGTDNTSLHLLEAPHRRRFAMTTYAPWRQDGQPDPAPHVVTDSVYGIGRSYGRRRLIGHLLRRPPGKNCMRSHGRKGNAPGLAQAAGRMMRRSAVSWLHAGWRNLSQFQQRMSCAVARRGYRLRHDDLLIAGACAGPPDCAEHRLEVLGDGHLRAILANDRSRLGRRLPDVFSFTTSSTASWRKRRSSCGHPGSKGFVRPLPYPELDPVVTSGPICRVIADFDTHDDSVDRCCNA